jgi:hypothetical protein
MPCWGRPERTKRAIENILAQDLQGWEAIVVGDGCPHFQKLMDSGWLEEKKQQAKENGNLLFYYNLDKNYGGCGYHITNTTIKGANGEYMLFMGNDDSITPFHFSHYYNSIKDTDLHYMYFNSFLHPLNQTRISKLAPSEIGHSEIIVRTDLAKAAPPHQNKYGHDWDFLRYIIENGKGKKSESPLTTYFVMSIPNFGTRDKID